MGGWKIRRGQKSFEAPKRGGQKSFKPQKGGGSKKFQIPKEGGQKSLNMHRDFQKISGATPRTPIEAALFSYIHSSATPEHSEMISFKM